MSMQDYDTAIERMLERPDLMNFVGPRPETLVQVAEEALQLRFPPTYRRFLLEFGAGSFGGEDVYGLIDANFEKPGAGDAISTTLQERTMVPYPPNFVTIYGVGNGETFCLDIDSQHQAEARVVAFNAGLPLSVQRYEVIAEDFGALLLQLVQIEFDFRAEYGDD